MIATRRFQSTFADGLIAEEVSDLWEPWMRHADQAIDDDQLLDLVQSALSLRYKKSKTRGRPGATAEVILRLLLLKHIRDWSYEVVAREVRANLVYRHFTRIGGGKVPDDKSISRFGRQLGADVIEKLHQRMVEIAAERKIVQGRKMRVDTTVVESNIHYPTDSTLLSDGVRFLTRVMKKVTEVSGNVGCQLRDRTRSVKRRILEIARASRDKSERGKQRLTAAYSKLLNTASRVAGQAKRFSAEITSKVKQGPRRVLRKAKQQLDGMIPLLEQVMRQTRQRVLGGDTRAEGKIVSVFEPQTEVIRKGRQAHRIRQAGQDSGSGTPDHYALRSFRSTPERFSAADPIHSAAHRAVRPRSAPGRRGCRILLGSQRSSSRTVGREIRGGSQPIHQERCAQAAPETTVVQESATVAHRMRGAHQRSEAPARSPTQPL